MSFVSDIASGIGDAVSTIAGVASDVVSTITSPITDALSVISNFIGIPTPLAQAATAIGEAFSGVGIDDLATFVDTPLQDFSLDQNIVDETSGALEGPANAAIAAGASGDTTLGQLFTEASAQETAAAMAVAEQADTGVATAVQSATSPSTITQIVDATKTVAQVAGGINAVTNLATGAASGSAQQIAAGLAGTASSAAAVASDATSAANTAISTVAAPANDSFLGSVTGVINSLTSTVNSVTGTVRDFISPITTLAQGVAGLAQSINNGLIQPIIQPIVAVTQTIDRLETAIARDLDGSLNGIARFANDTANALDSLDATFQRSLRQLGEVQASIAGSNIKGPLGDLLTAGLSPFREVIANHLAGQALNVTERDVVDLTPDNCLANVDKVLSLWKRTIGAGLPDFKATLGVVDDAISAATKTVLDPILVVLKAVLESFVSLQFLISFIEGQRECFAAEGRKAAPFTLLEPGDIVEARRRGIINDRDFIEEMLRHGIKQERAQTLLDNARFLFPLGDLTNLVMRGIVDAGTAKFAALQLGTTEDQFTAALEGAKSPAAASDLQDAFARGIIDDGSFSNGLAKAGLNDDAAKLAKDLLIGVPSITARIGADANARAAEKQWFPETYGSQAPADVLTIAASGRVAAADAQATWTQHFNTMPIQTAVALFFRGQLNRDEVRIVVEQNNFPPAMADMFIDVQDQLLEQRTIPSLLVRGSISEAEARERLAERGFRIEDIDILLRDAVMRVAKAKAAPASKQTQLSLEQLATAFDDGLIDLEDYRRLLGQHGLDASEVEITVQLRQLALARQERKDEIDTIKTQLEIGTISIDDATQALFQQGFTVGEVDKALVQFLRSKRTAAKIPGLAELDRMLKKGIIDETTYVDTLRSQGFSEFWSERLKTLVLGG